PATSSTSQTAQVPPSPAAATTTPAQDTAVGQYLRSMFSKEQGYADFAKSRMGVITVAEVIKMQYSYVQSKVERYVNMRVPLGSQPEEAVGVVINKTHVLKAFNMTPTWGEECSDVLRLTALYGPRGERCQDARVVKMLDETPPVTTGMFVKQYLGVLRDVHARWCNEHP
ncbi:hypothetical protein BXZ70DRAFT_866181, partial [Cristinia sonorae]